MKKYIFLCFCVLVLMSCKKENKTSLDTQIKTNIITVANTSDFIIRNTIRAIQDATYYNRYIVFVPNGNYFEMDIQTKNYIDVEGQSTDGVTITCDGNSKKIAPYPLSIGVYGNTPINTISNNWKHVFFLNHSCEIRNLTVVAKNCKYVVHQDGDGDYESSIKNCKLIADIDTYRCIGIGSRAGQYQRFKDLDLVMENPEIEAIGWHNYGPTVGVKKGSGMEAVNCRSNYKFIDVADLGSERQDVVRLVNCRSLNPSSADIVFTAILGFWPNQLNPATDKLLLPYSILVVKENSILSVGQILRPNYRLF